MGRVPVDYTRCAKTHKLHYGSGLPVFRGEYRHSGYGLGNLLSGLAKSVIPVLAPLGKSLAKNMLKVGAHVASDVLSGKDDFKSSAKKRISGAIDKELRSKKPTSKRRKLNQDIFSNL